MFTYRALTVVEPRTMRPIVGRPVRVYDSATGDPVQTYDLDGNPAPVVTGSRGQVGQFKADSALIDLKVEGGDPGTFAAIELLGNIGELHQLTTTGRLSETSLQDTIGAEVSVAVPPLVADAIAADGTVAQAAAAAADTAVDEKVTGLDLVTSHDPTFTATAAAESATLGPELVDGTGWTLGAGWTGDHAGGFTHTPGSAAPLSRPVTLTPGAMYRVQLRLTPTAQLDGGNGTSDFTVSLGGSPTFVTYKGAAASRLYVYGLAAPSTGDLVITPEPRYDGVITEVSVREIVAVPDAAVTFLDTTGAVSTEIRPGRAEHQNAYFGSNAGANNLSGHQNAAHGVEALGTNTSGFWNAAIGYNALRDNTVGSRNVAAGFQALQENTTGDRNIGVGPFALTRNTHGRGNVAVGYDSLWVNTTGEYNVAVGGSPLGSNETGSHNIAIGYAAGDGITAADRNIAIGFEALQAQAVHNGAVAIGSSALKRYTEHNGVAIGANAATFATTASGTTAVGTHAGYSIGSGINNTAIGHYALGSGAAGTGLENTAVGAFAGQALTGAAGKNTLLGYRAGATTTTGSNNLLIGRLAYASTATASNELNIGNVLFGNLVTKKFRIGEAGPTASLHLPAGTSGSWGAPLKFTAGTLLTSLENGSVEYDGTALYITLNGVRQRLVTEPA